MTAATDIREACQTYLAALDRERRADKAESDAFRRYMEEPTEARAGTARKAKSRTNALNHLRERAESPVWDALDDQDWDDTPAGKAARQADPERFARAIVETTTEKETTT